MKCIKNSVECVRVYDQTAANAVKNAGYKYASKEEWKKSGRKYRK